VCIREHISVLIAGTLTVVFTQVMCNSVVLVLRIGYELYAAWTIPDAIPEPTTTLLLGCGLIGLAGARRNVR